jgi:hypothetical protein
MPSNDLQGCHDAEAQRAVGLGGGDELDRQPGRVGGSLGQLRTLAGDVKPLPECGFRRARDARLASAVGWAPDMAGSSAYASQRCAIARHRLLVASTTPESGTQRLVGGSGETTTPTSACKAVARRPCVHLPSPNEVVDGVFPPLELSPGAARTRTTAAGRASRQGRWRVPDTELDSFNGTTPPTPSFLHTPGRSRSCTTNRCIVGSQSKRLFAQFENNVYGSAQPVVPSVTVVTAVTGRLSTHLSRPVALPTAGWPKPEEGPR